MSRNVRRIAGGVIGVLAVASAVGVSAQYLNTNKLVTFVPPRATAQQPITQLVVKYKGETEAMRVQSVTTQRMDVLSASAGVKLTYKRPMGGAAHVLYLPRAMSVNEAKAIAAKIAANPNVEYAEPDYVRRALVVPTDPGYAPGFNFGSGSVQGQWDLMAPTGSYTYRASGVSSTVAPVGGANLPAAWDIAKGSGVVIGVVDTGLTSHPDLNANMVGGSPASSGYDFISMNVPGIPSTDPNFTANDGDGRDSDPSDPGDWMAAGDCGTNEPATAEGSSWHGTHVSGTIAAVANNNAGIAGVAYQAKVLMARALGKCGGNSSDISDAMRWAAGVSVPGVPTNTNPAKVVSLSLGGSTQSGPEVCGTTEQNAVNAVRAVGAVVVAATGNDGTAYIAAPSSCAGVIAVTAHTIEGDKADYANYGDSGDGANGQAPKNTVTISAPGGGCGTSITASTSPACANQYVWSTLNSGTQGPANPGYAGAVGTSMATPHVAGVAGLLFSLNPSLLPDTVASLLTSTARPFPAGTYCATGGAGFGKCGAGMLDAAAAVTQLLANQPTVSVGADQAAQGHASVTLTGSGTISATSGASGLTYAWTQTGGGAVTLATPNAATTTFTANNTSETLAFKLTVTDSKGYAKSATTHVTVTAVVDPTPPTTGGGGGGGAVGLLGFGLLALGAWGLRRNRALVR